MNIELFLIALKRFEIFSDMIAFVLNGAKFFTNNIVVVDDYGNKKRVYRLKNLKLKINGSCNIIEIHKTAKFNNLSCFIEGNNNRIVIGRNCRIDGRLYLNMACQRNNRYICIHDDVNIVQAELFCWGEGSSIHIKSDCLLSSGIKIRNNDGHLIYDMDGNRIKDGKSVIIGEHCWIGADVTVLKNVELASNTIVGASSVVTKSFTEENCAIAGNPAKIIKRNFKWSKENS